MWETSLPPDSARRFVANRRIRRHYVRHGRKEVVQLSEKRQVTPEVIGC